METIQKVKRFSHTIPFLPVKDLQETIAYYRYVLGFSQEWFWGDPPTDAGISRDDMKLLFGKNPEMVKHLKGFEIMMFVEGIDTIYEEHKIKGVTLISDIENKPWGVREYTVEEINGYHLRIAEGIEKIIE